MKALMKNLFRLDRVRMTGRRRFLALLVSLGLSVPLLLRSLSGQPRRDLSLHEADFYRSQKPDG